MPIPAIVYIAAAAGGAYFLLRKKPGGPIPPLLPVAKQADGTVSAAELARSLAEEKARAAALTSDQLVAIDQAAVPGVNVAAAGNLETEGTPMPAGTFQPGDIIPTDRVTVNSRVARAAGLPIPAPVIGDFLIRVVTANTADSVRGVIIDPRIQDGTTERDFPLSAVTGVGPVGF